MFLWQAGLPEALGQLGFPPDLVDLARAYPLAVPAIGTLVILSELGLETYVLIQVKKTYDWLSQADEADDYDEEAAAGSLKI